MFRKKTKTYTTGTAKGKATFYTLFGYDVFVTRDNGTFAPTTYGVAMVVAAAYAILLVYALLYGANSPVAL